MKTCSKCKSEKSLDDFSKGKSQCKSCQSIYFQEYKAKNPNKLKGRKRNPEYIKKYNKEYKEKNKEYFAKKAMEYYNNSVEYKLQTRISSIIRNALTKKNLYKVNKSGFILGISIEDFKLYLESKFEPWMNWQNYGKYNGELNYGWDIDHIIPISSAINEEEVLKLNHYTNLQPLCSKINRDIKKDKLNYV